MNPAVLGDGLGDERLRPSDGGLRAALHRPRIMLRGGGLANRLGLAIGAARAVGLYSLAVFSGGHENPYHQSVFNTFTIVRLFKVEVNAGRGSDRLWGGIQRLTGERLVA